MKKPLILLDFDGTIAPIKLKPEKVRMSGKMARALNALHAKGISVAVVSGRPASFLSRQLPRFVKLIALHGNQHRKASRKKVNGIYYALKAISRRVPHLKVEKKPNGAVAHYRGVSRSQTKKLELQVHKAAARLNAIIIPGRKAFELMPKGFSTKASAIRPLLRKCKGNIAFFGDDESDAQVAAEVVKTGGVAFLVKTPERNCTPKGVKSLNGITSVLEALQSLARGETF